MNDKAELTSISKFLDSKISFLLHKTKLKEIYSRPLRKFNVDFFAEDLSKRVSKNKKLSRERVEEQIMHFRNIDNRHMQQRLKGIQSRGNVIVTMTIGYAN